MNERAAKVLVGMEKCMLEWLDVELIKYVEFFFSFVHCHGTSER